MDEVWVQCSDGQAKCCGEVHVCCGCAGWKVEKEEQRSRARIGQNLEGVFVDFLDLPLSF